MNFDDETIQSVWEMAKEIARNNPNVWRQDHVEPG